MADILTAYEGCTQQAIDVDFVENTLPGDCPQSYTLERIWSVDNSCGSVSHTQYVTVEDTTDPILVGVPADQDVECTSIPAVPTVTATDNCDTDVQVTFSEMETLATCGYTLTRTWTATDDCGNEVSASQTIHVGDNTPPVLAGIPAGITVECNSIPAPVYPIAIDNCDNDVTISFNESILPGACEHSYTLVRTWTATDDCGLTTEGSQLISVQDTEAPLLIGVPNDVTVDLALGQMIPAIPNVIASDNCDSDVVVDYDETQMGTGCSYTLIRTWTAIDDCGLTTELSQTITVIGGLSVTETHVDASCGENNGSIDLTVSGGVAPIQFTWNNGIGNIEDPTNLAPGTYEVTVSDATGCSNMLTIVIESTPGLSLTTTSNMVSCYGGNDGSIDLTVNGGTAPYTYDWTGGIGNVEDPSGLTSGSYNVVVTDANGCSASTGVNVNQPQQLALTIDGNNVGCNGTLGSATANPTGGVAPYAYSWSDGQTSQTAINLTADTYSVEITDANGCTISESITISVDASLVVSIGSSNVTCYNANDGSATASVTGGSGMITYSWNNGGTTASITGLAPGTYTLVATDANGCIGEEEVTISQPDELVLTTSKTAGGCNGGLGSATVNVVGGTPGYTYLWNDPAAQTTATAIDLTAGTYEVLVSDSNGCTTTSSVTITQDLGLTVSIDETDVSCYGGNDGSASAVVSGGQPDYTYLWSNGATTSIISNVEAGSYTVTVSDTNGCTGTATVEINSAPQLILNTTATNAGAGASDGTATVSATGGTSPYTYIWSNGQMTSTITGLTAGNYMVTVLDDNGCFEVDQVEVLEDAPLNGVNIGDYVWFDANQNGIQDAEEFGFNNFMVKLVQAGLDGVFGTADDVIVATTTTMNNPAGTGAGYYLFENVAPGNYQIEFMTSSLPNGYLFSPSNQGGDDNLDSDANDITGRTPTFTVVMGQNDDLSFDAGIYPECDNVTNGGQIAATQTICTGETPNLLTNQLLPSGGTGALEYIWLSNTTGSPFSNNNPDWQIITGATDEFYQPGQLFETTFFIRCVRRAGCSDYLGESNPITIFVNTFPSAQMTIAPTSLCVNEEGTFQALQAGFGATYFWDFGGDASPQTSTDLTVYGVSFNTAGTKTVSLTVENDGCSQTIDYTLEVVNCLDFEITNFTATARANGEEAELDWTTNYEMNNSTYYLQHSKTGFDFKTFGNQAANGSAQIVNSYSGTHEDPYYGLNYYRIKYIDPNGNVVYSEVEAVIFGEVEDNINVFPNPVKTVTYVEILTEIEEDATIEVVDMTGRVLQAQIVSKGLTTYKVDLSAYPAGNYLIWVRYNKWRKAVEKVVKITE